jgi:selenocysteine lyase/cysteine desulfurase
LGVDACSRASLALYSDEADVAALLDAVAAAVATLT